MPHRLGYIRVSTSSGEQLSALENQRSRIEAAGVDEIIQDIQSGRDSDREGLLRLLGMMSRRQVSEVVFTRVDRLGRDAADTDAAIAFAAKHGVKLTALDGGTVESETPQGFIMSRIMTTMAEAESRMLSLRIKGGFAERRRAHLPYNGRAPWGYRISADKTQWEPDPNEWPRCQKFIALLSELNWRMNTALDIWTQRYPDEKSPFKSCRGVKAWLLNPVLRGGIGYKQLKNHQYEEVVWDLHTPLITHEQFAHIYSVLQENRRMWGHNATIKPRLLTGLCVCGICNRRMSYAGGRRIHSMVCKTRTCSQRYKSTHEELIADAVNEALAHRARDLAAYTPDEPQQVKDLRKRIRRAEDLNEPALADGINTMKEELRQLLSQKPAPAVRLDLLSNPETYRLASYERLRKLYQSTVSRIVVTNQAVEEVVLRF